MKRGLKQLGFDAEVHENLSFWIDQGILGEWQDEMIKAVERMKRITKKTGKEVLDAFNEAMVGESDDGCDYVTLAIVLIGDPEKAKKEGLVYGDEKDPLKTICKRLGVDWKMFYASKADKFAKGYYRR